MMTNGLHTLQGKSLRFLLLIVSVLCASGSMEAQEDAPRLRIGFNYGRGSQQLLPKRNENYDYETEFFKVQINHALFTKRKWTFELNIEPGLYKTEHQLLNEHYITPDWDENYEQLREEHVDIRSFEEYVLNLGFISRYRLTKNWSVYNLLSIGPMFATDKTERMAKGFAFSDILGCGFFYKINTMILDLRFSLRHVSNAKLREPNAGHNSALLESGLTFFLN